MHLFGHQMAKTITAGSSIIGVVTAGITVATMGSMLTPAAMLFAPITTVGGTAGLVVEAAGAGGIAAFGAYTSSQEAMGLALKKSQLYCQMKGCYGGGDGSWLVMEGGPYQDSNGYFRAQDLSIQMVGQEHVFRNGLFTRYFHDCYHTKSDLQCTAQCPYIGSNFS